jgi:hypothetical protein
MAASLPSWLKPQTNNRITILFLFCLGMHITDLLISFNPFMYGIRIIMWFFVWIVGWICLKQKEGFDLQTLGVSLGLSAISFAIPYLRYLIDFVVPTQIGNILVFFAPVWIIYIVYMVPDLPRWLHAFGVGYLLFWLIVFMLFAWRSGYFEQAGRAAGAVGLQAAFIDVKEPLAWLWGLLQDSYVNGLKLYMDFNYTQRQQKLMDYAVGGDLYTAEVDKNAQEKLGVFLEKTQASQPDGYFTDEPVSVWGTLVARTFDEPMQIAVNCVADKGTPQEKGPDSLTPQGRYEVEVFDEQDVDCSFPAKSFEKGSHDISLFVNFTFRTSAYQKVYFVDRTRAIALGRDGIDILDYYGIKENKPKAKYTSGPIMLGMQVSGTPIKLDRDASTDAVFMLGISLRNQWDGRIVSVSEVTITLPPYATIQGSKCGDRDVTSSGAGVYSLSQALGPTETVTNLRCPVVISASRFSEVLGETPISTQYFKATTFYMYEFRKKIPITVKLTVEELKAIEATRPTVPVIAMSDIITMGQNEPRTIDLGSVASDAETAASDLKFSIVSQSNTNVVNCVIQGTSMTCTSRGVDGTSDVVFAVTDGANRVTKRFRITVGAGAQSTSTTGTSTSSTTSNSCADRINYPTYCEGSQYKLRSLVTGACITKCEYYQGCYGIGTDWSCACTLQECNSLESAGGCIQGYCPGSTYCCSPTQQAGLTGT